MGCRSFLLLPVISIGTLAIVSASASNSQGSLYASALAIAVLGSRTHLRELAKSARCHHHQNLRTNPYPGCRRWSDHRTHCWQVGCVSSA